MRYTTPGRTQIQESSLCLGTMTFGAQNTETEAHLQLDRAIAAGINFIDTAELYPVPPKTDTQVCTEKYLSCHIFLFSSYRYPGLHGKVYR